MKKEQGVKSCVLLLLIVSASLPVFSAQLDVYPGYGTYPTIQDAIDAANAGDVIYVHNGTYTDDVDVDKCVSITGESKTGAIVDGGCIELFPYGVGSDDVLIEKLTIQNCQSRAMLIYSQCRSLVTIKECIIQNNSSTKHGAGMYVCCTSDLVDEEVIIENCEFIGNTSDAHGGALYVELNYSDLGYDEADCIVRNCIFTDNTSVGGGAIYAAYFDSDRGEYWANMTIAGCIFNGNIVNHSAVMGSAIYIEGDIDYSGWDIDNCTFYGNMCGDYNTPAVIAFDTICFANIRNCIFSENGTLWGITPNNMISTQSGTIEFISNCLQLDGVFDSSYFGYAADNFTADPLFADPEGLNANVDDFSLQDGSPCINEGYEGSSGYFTRPSTSELPDVYGNVRIHRGTIDVGAAELVLPWYVGKQTTGTRDGWSPETPFLTIQEGIDAAVDGDAVIVAGGTYTEEITIDMKDITVCSEDSFSSVSPAERTIIDAGGAGTAVAIYECESIVKGFSITGGESLKGAGVFVASATGPVGLINCIITENDASTIGGGIYSLSSDMELINCVIAGNTATTNGGGLYKNASSDYTISLRNCTVYGNSAGSSGGGLYNDGSYSYLKAYNSILWDNAATNYPDYRNIYRYDCYIEQDGYSTDPGFVSVLDNFRLLESSPCIDQGTNSYYTDSDYTGSDLAKETDLAGCSRLYDGDQDYTVTIDIGAYEYQPSTRLYVDVSEPNDALDGSSWAKPFKYLQDAFNAAAESNGEIEEIWVADGTYYPTKSKDDLLTTGLREDSFVLVDGIELYGGFQGASPDFPGGEGYLNQRDEDISANPTILSGDIDSTGDEDSYHVLTGLNLTEGLLDRFTVESGNADGTLANCNGGGGVFIHSKYKIEDCILTDNIASGQGGALYLTASYLEIFSSIFTGNDAEFGAALFNYASSPELKDCDFVGNAAGSGGAIMNHTYSDPNMINCIFQSNAASGGATNAGGAIANEIICDPNIVGCVFAENTATNGGAIFSRYGSMPLLTNCTVAYNEASAAGGGIYSSDLYCAVGVYNSILWGNLVNSGDSSTVAQIDPLLGAVIDYSCVTAITGGGTNTNSDPCFLDPTLPNLTIDRTHSDSLYITAAACIDTGLNNYVPRNLYSDIAGYKRIQNNVVDMGAYETGSELPDPGIIILAFVNEASDYTVSDCEADFAAYQTIMASEDYADLIFKAGCFVPPDGMASEYDSDDPVDDVIPSGVDTQEILEEFIIENFRGTNAVTDDFWTAYSDLNSYGLDVQKVIIVADASGSMSNWQTTTGFATFLDELSASGVNCYIMTDDDSEEWIGMINEVMLNPQLYLHQTGQAAPLAAPASAE